jgi:hypothetical protein
VGHFSPVRKNFWGFSSFLDDLAFVGAAALGFGAVLGLEAAFFGGFLLGHVYHPSLG